MKQYFILNFGFLFTHINQLYQSHSILISSFNIQYQIIRNLNSKSLLGNFMERWRRKLQLQQKIEQKVSIIKQKLIIREQIISKKLSIRQCFSLREIQKQLKIQNQKKIELSKAKIRKLFKEITILKTKLQAESFQQKQILHKINEENSSINAIKTQIQEQKIGYETKIKVINQELSKIRSENLLIKNRKQQEILTAQQISTHIRNQQKARQKCKESSSNCLDELKKTKFQNKKINLHVQQQRGNIRVYCRIRPFREHQEHQIMYSLDSERTVLSIKIPEKLLRSSNNASNFSFMFEKIFDVDRTQADVFEQLQTLISCSMQGNNVCIFAYGQTGSGKTYTMQGMQGQHEGVIPRSVSMLFKQIEEQTQFGWSFKVILEIQQIYLDEVKSLIVNIEKSQKKNQCSQNVVRNQAEVRNLFENAQKIRKTASTKCNVDSSRSHLVFTLKIEGRCGNSKKQGSIVIVDLAGSQRMDQSGVQGERQKQTIAINSSLSSLGKMIFSLAASGKDKTKQVHVPYRQSKLTKLLQPYMTNGSKVLMFVNISPNIHDISQTINSLRFAESVQQTKVKKKN